MHKNTYNLEKTNKLINKKEFDKVFKSPKVAYSKEFVVLAIKNKECCNAKFGVIVAKKKIKQANKRNKIKRIVREFFRLNKNKFASLNFIFIANKNIDKFQNQALFKSLNASCTKLQKLLVTS